MPDDLRTTGSRRRAPSHTLARRSIRRQNSQHLFIWRAEPTDAHKTDGRNDTPQQVSESIRNNKDKMADDGKKNATNTQSEARERLLRYLDKVGIPDTITSKIDINTLHESIDDIRKATEVQRNTWALNCIQGYDVPKIAPVGMEILTYFQEDFAEWTVDDFIQLDRHIRRALRLQLVSKGIYLGKLNAPINNRLADLLRMTKLPEWDEDDLLETETLNPTSPAYKQREKLLATRPRNTSPFATPRATTALKREGTAVPHSRPEVKTEQSQDHQDFQQKTTGHSEVRTPSQSPSPAPEPNLLHPGERPQTIQPQTNWQPTRDLSPQPIPHGGYSDALAYRRLPPAKVEEEPLLPHLVERFIKIWNKDMNYTGEPYDICKLGLQGWVLLREQWARGGVNNACGCNTRVISEELESGALRVSLYPPLSSSTNPWSPIVSLSGAARGDPLAYPVTHITWCAPGAIPGLTTYSTTR